MMTDVNLELLRSELTLKLPLHASWFLSVRWDWDFTRAKLPLRPFSEREITGGLPTAEERLLYIFGEQDFSEGGGASPYVGVHIGTGEVYGIDVERDASPLFLMNSSVQRFIETFFLFDEVLRTRSASPNGLTERFRMTDSEAFDKSEWRDVIAEIGRSVP